MIVSYRHRFVFMKSRKVAGSSVEQALATMCGPDDILTRGSPGSGEAQNHAVPLRCMSKMELLRALRRRRRPTIDWHVPAADVRSMLGADTWQDYFTFSIERNPWDKAVSLYFWELHTGGRLATRASCFSEWLHDCPATRLSNWNVYSIDGEIAVDRVLQFERIGEEFAALWGELFVSDPPSLPRDKADARPEGRRWGDLASRGDAERVGWVCRREIEAFGYTVDGQRIA